MTTCPKCGAEMETGELQGVFNWASISRGASFLKRARQSLKLVKVQGLRCTRCGFLELFAQPPRSLNRCVSCGPNEEWERLGQLVKGDIGLRGPFNHVYLLLG